MGAGSRNATGDGAIEACSKGVKIAGSPTMANDTGASVGNGRNAGGSEGAIAGAKVSTIVAGGTYSIDATMLHSNVVSPFSGKVAE
jgi:hypothetical protein